MPIKGTAGPVSATPERSLQQRLDALKDANKIRSLRAQLKRNVKSRRQSVPAVIANPPEYVETMKVFDLLVAQPKMGRVKANRAMQHCRVSPSKTLGGLTDRQRGELVSELRRAGR